MPINWIMLSNEEVAAIAFAIQKEHEAWRKEHRDDDAPTPQFMQALETLAHYANQEYRQRKLQYKQFVRGPVNV